MRRKRVTGLTVFAGFPAGEAVREEAFRLQTLLRPWVTGSYPARENFHVTLAYLGEIPQERVPEVLEVLYALPFPDCELTFDSLAAFTAHHRDTIVFLAQCPKELAAYREALHEKLLEKGFEPDPAPFRPHITLVRAKTGGHDLAGMEVIPETMKPAGAVLFHSFQSGGKRIYLPLG